MVVKAPEALALDRSAQSAVRNLRKLRAERDELDIKIKAAEQKIKAAMGDSEEATVGGKIVVTWRKVIRRTLSKTLVEKRAPEIIDECTVLNEVRTFKLIEDV